jgi:hypothetical protein
MLGMLQSVNRSENPYENVTHYTNEFPHFRERHRILIEVTHKSRYPLL